VTLDNHRGDEGPLKNNCAPLAPVHGPAREGEVSRPPECAHGLGEPLKVERRAALGDGLPLRFVAAV
jgi:hypothetical protein